MSGGYSCMPEGEGASPCACRKYLRQSDQLLRPGSPLPSSSLLLVQHSSCWLQSSFAHQSRSRCLRYRPAAVIQVLRKSPSRTLTLTCSTTAFTGTGATIIVRKQFPDIPTPTSIQQIGR